MGTKLKGESVKVTRIISVVIYGLLSGTACAHAKDKSNTITRTLSIGDLNDPEKMKDFEEFFEQYVDAGNIKITTHIHHSDDSLNTFQTTPTEITTMPQETTATNSESCKAGESGECLWIELIGENINFTKANEICEANDAVIARIPDENTYNATVDSIRSITNGSKDFWVGMNVSWDLNVRPQDWFYNLNSTNASVEDTRPYIKITRSNRWQGMKDVNPNNTRDGVICEKPAAFNNSDGRCDKSISANGQYFCVIMSDAKISYSTAASNCDNMGAKVARIPDEKSYIKIVKAVRAITPSTGKTKLWIQVESDWYLNLNPSSYSWDSGDRKKIEGSSGNFLNFHQSAHGTSYYWTRKYYPHSWKLDGVLCKNENRTCTNWDTGFCCYRCGGSSYNLVLGSSRVNYSEAVEICNSNQQTVVGSNDVFCPQSWIEKTDYCSSNQTYTLWTAENISLYLTLNPLSSHWDSGYPKVIEGSSGISLNINWNTGKSSYYQKLQNHHHSQKLDGVLCKRQTTGSCLTGTGAADFCCYGCGGKSFNLVLRSSKVNYSEAAEICNSNQQTVADSNDVFCPQSWIEKTDYCSSKQTYTLWTAENISWYRDLNATSVREYWDFGYPKIIEGLSHVSINIIKNGSTEKYHVGKWQNHPRTTSLNGVLCIWKAQNSNSCHTGGCFYQCDNQKYCLQLWASSDYNYSFASSGCSYTPTIDDLICLQSATLQEACVSGNNVPQSFTVGTKASIHWKRKSLDEDDRFYSWFYGFPRNETNRTSYMLEVRGNNTWETHTFLAKPNKNKLNVLCWKNSSTNCPEEGKDDVVRAGLSSIGCLWFQASTERKTFTGANETCSNHGGQIARIPDKDTFDTIVEELRFVADEHARREIWVDADIKWVRQNHPCTGVYYKWFSENAMNSPGPLSISVSGNAGNYAHGMRSHNISASLNGVVCWKPQKDSCPSVDTVNNTKPLNVCKDHEIANVCGCYWIEMNKLVNYSEAESVCQKYDSNLIELGDQKTADAIREYVAKNLTRARASIWVGIVTNQNILNNADSCSAPTDESDLDDKTQVYIDVDKTSCKFSFVRATSEIKTNGVMCWKKCIV